MRRVVAAFAAAASCASLAAGVAHPLERPAVVSKHATKSVLLDIALAGPRVVAVGERGIVVLSDDGGRTWRQGKVPVSVSVTKVTFVDARKGWAVGHYGVVLHSSDGGESWQRQLDGHAAARIALDTLQRKAPQSQQLNEVRRWVAEGADKPFLALHFTDDRNGFVVGAHNLVFRTRDGGRTWEYWSDRVDNPEGLHLYAVGAAGAWLYLAGEQGLFLRSRDGGESFTRVATPFKTSYFTFAATATGTLVLAGLRGRAIRSSDGGDTWTSLETNDHASFVAAAEGMRVVLGNQAGQLFVTSEGGTLQLLSVTPVHGLTGTVISGGTLFASSTRGVVRIDLPRP